ncbi:transcriptional regulator CdaR [Rhodococcus opacus M213]|uniref:Transcriptional regulator CdaR n=1 Tax=Rhodococcus opacus M213 TaxID=1129896 RepID=K8XJ79_RHOOP|nr:GAF domain-containing protein [Rhodococcus opacus]EKT81454.1 transcriptional regulator CdaR [Rhodococcus opacus M213]
MTSRDTELRPSAELLTWLTSLRTLSAAAASGDGLREVLDLVARTARSLLGFDFCGVLTPNDAGTSLLITGWSGLSDEYVARINADRPVGLDSTAPSAQAFHTGRPVTIRDITAEPQFTPWGGVARDQGYRAIVSVPLVAEGHVLGTLNGYYTPLHTFTQHETERMSLLANHAAIALTSARRLDELSRLNESLRAQRDILTRSEQIHERLLDVTLRAGGLDGITRVLAELIGRPVLVEDARGTVLATAGDSARLPDPDWTTTATDATSSTKPVRVEDGQHPFWVASVRLDGEVVARIWYSGDRGGLDQLGERAVEHAALVISLELFRIRTGVETEHRLRGELLAELLTPGSEVTEQLSHRAQYLGHDLARPHIAIVGALGATEEDASTHIYHRALTAVSDLVRPYRPRPLAAMHHGRIVVLWPIGSETENSTGTTIVLSEQQAAERLYTVMNSVSPTTAASVALSTHDKHGTYAQAYRMARGALDIALRAGRSGTVVTLADLGLTGLLLQLDDPAQLLAFADRTLAPLLAYDRDHRTHLLETLQTYLARKLNRAETAQELHLHPNTVKQRIQRIEHLTRTDLADPATVVHFSTALTIRGVATADSSSTP